MSESEGPMRRWLRRWLGPDPLVSAELSRQTARAIRLIDERDAARSQLTARFVTTPTTTGDQQ